MIILSKEQVLGLHTSLIEATGGCDGIPNEGMLDSALNNPFQLFDGKELYPSIQAKAAQLCFGLVKKEQLTIVSRKIQLKFQNFLFFHKLCYNIRKGQSQVIKKTVAKLA